MSMKVIVIKLKVHFIRSVERVAKRVNSKSRVGRDAFVAIGKHILKADTADDILMLFEVMRGKKSIGEAKCVPSQFLCSDKECSEWAGASSWVDWWLRERHLRK
jgi:hypothetical protein